MIFGISEAVHHWSVYRPTAIAIVAGTEVLTYALLNQRIDAICRHIGEPATKKDSQRLGIAVCNKPLFLATLIAGLRAGWRVVVLNAELEPHALRQCASEAGVEALVYDTLFQSKGAEHRALLTEYAAQRVDGASLQTAEFHLLYDGYVAGSNEEWGVLYSSGTTGIPKGIPRSHDSIVVELLGWCVELELTKKTHFYIGRPVFYTGGLVLALSTLLVGGSIGLDPDVTYHTYLAHVQRRATQYAFFVPDQLREYSGLAEGDKRPGHAAQTILVMGDPISGKEKQRAGKLLGSQVIESWGNSESLGTITKPGDLETKPDSIGKPFLTDRLYIVDAQGNCLPPHAFGFLAGGRESGFEEYCSRPEETEQVLRNDLSVSDDVGYMDEDGYFYVLGRVQDCVRVGDDLVPLSTVEESVRGLSNVSDCAVIRVAEAEDRPEVAVIVVTDTCGEDSSQELTRRVADVIDPRLTLKQCVVADSIPRNPAGKTARDALCKLLNPPPPT